MQNSRDPVFHVIRPPINEAKERTVLLLEDEDCMHRMVGRLLRDSGNLILLCAHTCAEASEILDKSQVHLVLIDVGLSCGENGLSFLKGMRNREFRGKACVLSGYDSAEIILDALLAGADSYLVKGELDHSLQREVYRLLGLDEGSGSDDRFAASGLLRSFGLSDEQVRLLTEYVRRGFPSQVELCESLGLAPQTLSNRFCRIEKKLGFNNRNQLVRFLTVASGFGARRRPREDVQ